MKLTQKTLQRLILAEMRQLREAPEADEAEAKASPAAPGEDDPRAIAEEHTLEELRQAMRLYHNVITSNGPDLEDGLNDLRRELTSVFYDLKDKQYKAPVKALIDAIENLDDAFGDVLDVMNRRGSE
jgi:hypothetical protein